MGKINWAHMYSRDLRRIKYVIKGLVGNIVEIWERQ